MASNFSFSNDAKNSADLKKKTKILLQNKFFLEHHSQANI